MTLKRTIRRSTAAALTVISTVTLVSCGGSDSTGSDTTLATSEASVFVTNQWARTSPMATSMGAAYMDISATEGDELLSAAVDASVAGTVELHEVVMSGGDGHSMTDETSGHSMTDNSTGHSMAGEMKMQKVDKISLSAGETVTLKPGGYHVMLLDLVAPLETGSTIQITLTFATAGQITIDVPVLDDAP